jgi:hypothetical protein
MAAKAESDETPLSCAATRKESQNGGCSCLDISHRQKAVVKYPPLKRRAWGRDAPEADTLCCRGSPDYSAASAELSALRAHISHGRVKDGGLMWAGQPVHWIGDGKLSPEFLGVMLFGMQNAKNNHSIISDSVENLVRKPRCQQSVESAVIHRSALGVPPQAADKLAHLPKELVAQAGVFTLIPVPRFLEIDFGTGTDGDLPSHGFRLPRIRASTLSQVEPASGFRS